MAVRQRKMPKLKSLSAFQWQNTTVFHLRASQEIIQEIPEVQIVEKVVEVPQVLKQPLEHLVEEIIHVPKAGPRLLTPQMKDLFSFRCTVKVGESA